MKPSASEKLVALLKSLPEQAFASHTDFLTTIVPQFAQILGYAPEEVFFEPYLANTRMRSDAMLAPGPTSRPWLVVEVKLVRDDQRNPPPIGRWRIQLKQFSSTSGSPAILISPFDLLVRTSGSTSRYSNSEITSEQADGLVMLLGRATRGAPAEEAPPAPAQGNERLDQWFLLTRRALSVLLDNVNTATTNAAKGASLEELAAQVFASAPFCRVKHRNLTTASSEIDLVLEFTPEGVPHPFHEAGRYVLVECKNWAEPVGAKHIRDYLAKLAAVRATLGILFSANGVTGADAGADALREIQRAFDKDNASIAVVTKDDLARVLAGDSFLDVIDARLDRLRFNRD